MRIRHTLLLILTIAIPLVARAQATPSAASSKPAQLPADSMELGRRYAIWLYTAQSDSIIAHMDSAGRAQVGNADRITNDAAQIATRVGSETTVLEEKFITRNGARQYWRTSTFSNLSEPFLVRFVMGSKGEFLGRGLGPASQAPPIDP